MFATSDLYILVTDFLYQHRVAIDGATSEVEVLDTCGCAVNIYFAFSCHLVLVKNPN